VLFHENVYTLANCVKEIGLPRHTLKGYHHYRIFGDPADYRLPNARKLSLQEVVAVKRILVLAIVMLGAISIQCQSLDAQEKDPTTGTFLLTIFMKHDQSKTLAQINEHLDNTGFWRDFPPEGTQVVSWYVMMGIGQVITLRVPPEKLRDVNLVIEKKAWGAYRSEFYPTYDFKPVWESTFKKK
jgi:hypothetical protein